MVGCQPCQGILSSLQSGWLCLGGGVGPGHYHHMVMHTFLFQSLSFLFFFFFFFFFEQEINIWKVGRQHGKPSPFFMGFEREGLTGQAPGTWRPRVKRFKITLRPERAPAWIQVIFFFFFFNSNYFLKLCDCFV